MAQYFVDFSADTVGQPPEGWTLYGFSSSELTVIEDATARGGKALRSYTTSNARRFASFDAAGSVEDSEVLVRFKCGDDKIVFPAVLREQGDDMSTMSAHFVQKSTDILTLRKYVSGAASDTASVSDPLENTIDWAYMRFRVSGSTLMVKTWAASEAEPAAWDIETTNASITGAGRLGAFAYYSSRELLIDSLGFATDGDTAPDAAVSAGGGMAGISVNVGGAAKAVVAAYANVGGVAKLVTAAYANVGGLPKQIF